MVTRKERKTNKPILFQSKARLREKGLGGGGTPSLETLEDMLRKAPNTDISLHRGLFTTEWSL